MQPDASGVPAAPFATIRDFGTFLTGKAEKSCSIELAVEARQLGGNLPFLSRAAGGLGLDVTCIGMLGERGNVDPLFAQMPCRLYSFALPFRGMPGRLSSLLRRTLPPRCSGMRI